MKTASRKRRVGRPRTGHRPVLAMRVHPDVYAQLEASAQKNKWSISEEAARRIGKTFALDRQNLELEDLKRLGVEEFLLGLGFYKVRDLEGHEVWAKGAPAVQKWMALSPELEAIIDRAVERALEKARNQ